MASNANEIMEYFMKESYDQLVPILMGEDTIIYYDITVDLLDFIYNFPFLGGKFHEHPFEFLEFLKDTLVACQQKIVEKDEDKLPVNVVVKKNLDVKLLNIPPTKEVVAESIRAVNTEYQNKFIILTGTVVRTGHVNSRELFKQFKCRQCEKEFTCESDITEYNNFKLPQRCDGKVQTKENPFFKIAKTLINNIKNKNMKGQLDENQNFDNPKREANTGFQTSACKSKSFQPVDGTSEFSDYQEIKLQELFKTLKPGLIPRSMMVILQNTLVEICKPGDDVMITGVLIQRWKNMPPAPGTRPFIELALLANNVEVLNKREFSKSNSINMDTLNEFKRFWRKHDPIIGRQILIKSVCPNIYERYDVKLGLLLSLIGGVAQHQEETKFKVRGQVHLLMVGEPGTGKSQMLQAATHLSQRSVQTTGIGTTSAGLTVSCFKDGAEYVLEAGALVLADCGVCCIDEFSLIKNDDRASIHEAMEQQTISIAKGGIVCKINTRTTIIAATNPGRTQKWDPNYDLQQNTGIMSSLLSRFDLIFIMLDEHQVEDDIQKADFVLNRSCLNRSEVKQEFQLWPQEKLANYINFVQKVFEPVVTEEAEIMLKAYFAYLRMNPKVNKDRKTVRMLESIIRMTEAHARLLMKSQATVFDAICVIILMEHTLMTNLFGSEILPSIIMRSAIEYKQIRDDLTYRLGLDGICFGEQDESIELYKQCQTPSPVKRLEDSMFINNAESNFDFSFVGGSEFSFQSQDEQSHFFRQNSQINGFKHNSSNLMRSNNGSQMPNFKIHNSGSQSLNSLSSQSLARNLGQQLQHSSTLQKSNSQLLDLNISKTTEKYLENQIVIPEENSSELILNDDLFNGMSELSDTSNNFQDLLSDLSQITSCDRYANQELKENPIIEIQQPSLQEEAKVLESQINQLQAHIQANLEEESNHDQQVTVSDFMENEILYETKSQHINQGLIQVQQSQQINKEWDQFQTQINQKQIDKPEDQTLTKKNLLLTKFKLCTDQNAKILSQVDDQIQNLQCDIFNQSKNQDQQENIQRINATSKGVTILDDLEEYDEQSLIQQSQQEIDQQINQGNDQIIENNEDDDDNDNDFLFD
eukprot:403363933